MTSGNRIPLGISSCLCGDPVRYDGSHQRNAFLMDVLGDYVRWIKTCPEEQSGLGTPRETMRLVRRGDVVRLVTNRGDEDVTRLVSDFSGTRVEELAGMKLRGFVLKSNSPSCGMERVRLHNEDGVPSKTGVGIFARRLRERFPRLPIEEEGRLNDPLIRDNFVTRIFANDRWITVRDNNPRPRDIVEFHAAHKKLLLAHSPRHYQLLGLLVAKAGSLPMEKLLDQYEEGLMMGLREMASPQRHFNVLEHLADF